MLLEINVNSILETPSFNNLYKLLLLDKRRWIQAQKRLKTEEFETFCLCLHSNSLPLRVLPLIQEGEFY